MPPGFDNRLGDNWHLQLAIADLAGGEWPELARRAAMKLSKVTDTASTEQQLFAAIRAVFDAGGADHVSSAGLCANLAADPASPWREWKNDKPITQAQLASVLKPFGIAPEKIRPPGKAPVQGYKRIQFEDVWERYL